MHSKIRKNSSLLEEKSTDESHFGDVPSVGFDSLSPGKNG